MIPDTNRSPIFPGAEHGIPHAVLLEGLKNCLASFFLAMELQSIFKFCTSTNDFQRSTFQFPSDSFISGAPI